MQYGNGAEVNKERCLIQFKSYYVVWKLCEKRYSPTAIARLNRTMQYGNSGGSTIPKRPIAVFKSYYVVWKLN